MWNNRDILPCISATRRLCRCDGPGDISLGTLLVAFCNNGPNTNPWIVLLAMPLESLSYFQQDHAKMPQRSNHGVINSFLEQLIHWTQSPPLSPPRYQCDRAHLLEADNQQLSFRIGAESITNDSRSTLNLCHRKLKSLALWLQSNPHQQHHQAG